MLDDDTGVDFLPAKLIVILIVSSLLLVLLASGMSELSGSYSTYRARSEAQRAYELARSSYFTGYPGQSDERSVEVCVPGSVRVIGFGAMPGNGTPVRSDRTYFIEYLDGSTETYVADFPLADESPSGPCDGPVLLYPGEYRIAVCLETLNGTINACLSAEAI